MKFRLLTIGLLSAFPAFGAVSFQFSDFSNALTNISDSNGGSAVDGLTWGVLIDTNNDGSPLAGLAGSVGLNLQDGVDFGNGDLFYLGGTTQTVPGFDGGAGGITTAASVDVYSGAGVSANDRFYVMWFDTGIAGGSEMLPGTSYGLIDNGSLLLPADGDTGQFQTLFAGADPLRPANLTLVPEPSAVLLMLLSCVPLLRRKR